MAASAGATAADRRRSSHVSRIVARPSASSRRRRPLQPVRTSNISGTDALAIRDRPVEAGGEQDRRSSPSTIGEFLGHANPSTAMIGSPALRKRARSAKASDWSWAGRLRQSGCAVEPMGHDGESQSAARSTGQLSQGACSQSSHSHSRRRTGSRWPDAVASGLIGLALMATALTVRQQNRAQLTERGIDPATVERMRGVMAAQPGVVDVPDLFGIVVGPNMLVVDGDVTLADGWTYLRSKRRSIAQPNRRAGSGQTLATST